MRSQVIEPILSIENLSKTYSGGFKALDGVSLDIEKGEIFGLLGPNGAGKTTLIGAVCGLVRPSSGTIRVFGKNLAHDWRHVRQRIGLVPQELGFDMFDTVQRQVAYSRGLFGAAPDKTRIEEVLRSLSLWDKRGEQIRKLSGGMKRRVLIAKALAHEPEILFLDEPTAGVDVELRRDMWRQIDSLRERGVTIILTTHYLEEAQEMADRIGVIDKGRVLLVDGKDAMMRRLGRTEARFSLAEPLAALPTFLTSYAASLSNDGLTIIYRGGDGTGLGKHEVADIARLLTQNDLIFTAIEQRESTLEDIFVDLVAQGEPA